MTDLAIMMAGHTSLRPEIKTAHSETQTAHSEKTDKF